MAGRSITSGSNGCGERKGCKCPESSKNVGGYPLGGSENSCVRQRPLRPNHVWSYDFVADRTEDGRQLRMLVVIDEFTRESLAIEVAWSFTARQVVEVLQYLFAVRGAPEHIRSDNGPEFVAQRSDVAGLPERA